MVHRKCLQSKGSRSDLLRIVWISPALIAARELSSTKSGARAILFRKRGDYMKVRSQIILALYLLLSVLMECAGTFSAAPSNIQKRIRFNIVTVEERANSRSVISEAVIEGPQGT